MSNLPTPIANNVGQCLTDMYIFDPHEDSVKNIAGLITSATRIDELVSAAKALAENVETYAWLRNNAALERVRLLLALIEKAQAEL